MRRTGCIVPFLACAFLLVVSSMTEPLLAQTTRERVIIEEKVTTTHQSTTQTPLPSPGFTVTEPPPPPRQETITTAPAQVWVPGFWTWQNGWQWVAGSWEQPPQQMTTWVSGQWVQQGPNWAWCPEHWQ